MFCRAWEVLSTKLLDESGVDDNRTRFGKMSSKGHHSQQHPLHLNGFTYVVFGTKKHGNGKIDELERHIESLIWETVKERERECVGLDDYEKLEKNRVL
ncbi:predicted protein [Arabidopsis lyrata subsp. lyrata]|uniref:Predicted protein n=2 Tax=Arabidopsis TaxID=3701 RepID=D7KMY0_ARALL|nr:predicted protein [Arabidopsis lyrata subsp. lyrata]